MLAGCERLDPSGTTSAQGIAAMTERGHCFTATTEGGQAVYVVEVNNGMAWITAAKGEGAIPWRRLLLPMIEAQAAGCEAVGFQTARPGLVKAAQAQGYQVTGWILRKRLQ